MRPAVLKKENPDTFLTTEPEGKDLSDQELARGEELLLLDSLDEEINKALVITAPKPSKHDLDNAARFRQIILQKKRLKAEKLQKMKREMQRQNQARLQ